MLSVAATGHNFKIKQKGSSFLLHSSLTLEKSSLLCPSNQPLVLLGHPRNSSFYLQNFSAQLLFHCTHMYFYNGLFHELL